MNTQEFDISKYLDNEDIIIEYLKATIEENDTRFFMEALSHIAKARGMTEIAKKTGLGRESLYKAVSVTIKPKLETVSKIFNAAGLSLSVEKAPATK